MGLSIDAKLIVAEMKSRGWAVAQVGEDYKANHFRVTVPGIVQPILALGTAGFSTSLASALLCDDKLLFAKLMASANLPIPKTISISGVDLDATERSLEMINEFGSIVVKPVDTNFGVGITTNIQSAEELGAAIDLAENSTRSNCCIVQQQVSGDDYRFQVVDGKVVAVTKRVPARVFGDGTRTVGELIAAENNNPLRGNGRDTVMLEIKAEDAKEFVGVEGFYSIPRNAEEVFLSDLGNLSRGGEAVDVTDIAHDELKSMAISVAKALGLGVCEVDIMTTDCEKSIVDGGAYVIEANKHPGICMHHFPYRGTPRNVAKEIIDYMQRELAE